MASVAARFVDPVRLERRIRGIGDPGELEREASTPVETVLDEQRASVELEDAEREGEPQTEALGPGVHLAAAEEALAHEREIRLVDPGAVVGEHDDDHVVPPVARRRDRGSRRRVGDGVLQEVGDDAADQHDVAAGEQTVLDPHGQATVSDRTPGALADRSEHRGDVEGLEADPELARLQPGEVEDAADEAVEDAGVGVHAGEQLSSFPVVQLGPRLLQRGSRAHQHGQRRAHLVGDRREEVCLEAIALHQPIDGPASVFDPLRVVEGHPRLGREQPQRGDGLGCDRRVLDRDSDQHGDDPAVAPDRARHRGDDVAVRPGKGSVALLRVEPGDDDLATLEDEIRHRRRHRDRLGGIHHEADRFQRSVGGRLVQDPERGCVEAEPGRRTDGDHRHAVRIRRHLGAGPGHDGHEAGLVWTRLRHGTPP